MLRGINIIAILLLSISAYTQAPEIDSLRNVMATAKADTVLIKTRNQLAWKLNLHDLEEAFSHSDAEIRDGMDVAIFRIKDDQLEFSGANNPLWILRDNECIELKANKQPIGKYVKKFPFTLHSFKLQKEDTLYVFSDGYSDQFGGEKGKKMKVKNFKELVVSNIHKTVV